MPATGRKQLLEAKCAYLPLYEDDNESVSASISELCNHLRTWSVSSL